MLKDLIIHLYIITFTNKCKFVVVGHEKVDKNLLLIKYIGGNYKKSKNPKPSKKSTQQYYQHLWYYSTIDVDSIVCE